MDAELLHSAIRQCEADCDYIDELLANLLAQLNPQARPRVRRSVANQSLRRLLQGLDEHTFDVVPGPHRWNVSRADRAA